MRWQAERSKIFPNNVSILAHQDGVLIALGSGR